MMKSSSNGDLTRGLSLRNPPRSANSNSSIEDYNDSLTHLSISPHRKIKVKFVLGCVSCRTCPAIAKSRGIERIKRDIGRLRILSS